MQHAKALNEALLTSFSENYRGDLHKKAMTHVFSKTALDNLAYDPVKAKAMQFKFSVDLKTMSATNQKSSGRCWLFAATNLLREFVGKEKNLASFEFSQSFLAFWDKFERCNYFLEAILDTLSLPLGDRTLDHILQTGVNDGGQWEMFANIVRKYGLVPKDAMPETAQSSGTGRLNTHINLYLKKQAILLRTAAAAGCGMEELQAKKTAALDAVYSFLCQCYTEPPTHFDFEYVDKDGGYHLEKDYTPASFRDATVGNRLDEYVSIIHAPTPDKPFHALYTVQYLGNVVGGSPVRHLNLPLEQFKAAIVAQLKDGEPVWFGADCGKCGDNDKKVWDDQSYDYTLLTGLDCEMTKEEMLLYHVSQMNHAMLFTGVNLEDGRPNRYKIENSWGDGGPHGGYHSASDSWFDLYVCQAVVKRKYLDVSDELLASEPTVLLPWDPIGSLAD